MAMQTRADAALADQLLRGGGADGRRDVRPHIDRSATGGGDTDPGAGRERRRAWAEAAQTGRALRAKHTGSAPDRSRHAGEFGDRGPDDLTAEAAGSPKSRPSNVRSVKRVESSRPVCPPSGRAGFPACGRA